jgi:hypothetical protein
MPTTKISELEELTTAPANNDIMVVVDASTNETKKQEVVQLSYSRRPFQI